MAKCAICEKGAHFGNNVSHSHRKTPKMWKSNVKSVRVKAEGGNTKKMYVCTSCLKSGRVETLEGAGPNYERYTARVNNTMDTKFVKFRTSMVYSHSDAHTFS